MPASSRTGMPQHAAHAPTAASRPPGPRPEVRESWSAELGDVGEPAVAWSIDRRAGHHAGRSSGGLPSSSQSSRPMPPAHPTMTPAAPPNLISSTSHPSRPTDGGRRSDNDNWYRNRKRGG